MVDVLLVLEIEDEETFVYMNKTLPMAPFVGMYLMVGESAAWNQLVVRSIMVTFDGPTSIDCDVDICDGEYSSEFMKSEGWRSSRSR